MFKRQLQVSKPYMSHTGTLAHKNELLTSLNPHNWPHTQRCLAITLPAHSSHINHRLWPNPSSKRGLDAARACPATRIAAMRSIQHGSLQDTDHRIMADYITSGKHGSDSH